MTKKYFLIYILFKIKMVFNRHKIVQLNNSLLSRIINVFCWFPSFKNNLSWPTLSIFFLNTSNDRLNYDLHLKIFTKTKRTSYCRDINNKTLHKIILSNRDNSQMQYSLPFYYSHANKYWHKKQVSYSAHTVLKLSLPRV